MIIGARVGRSICKEILHCVRFDTSSDLMVLPRHEPLGVRIKVRSRNLKSTGRINHSYSTGTVSTSRTSQVLDHCVNTTTHIHVMNILYSLTNA